MVDKTPAKQLTYLKLVQLIKEEIELGKRLIEHQKALRYWNIGSHIFNYQLNGQDRATYGESLFLRLSEKLAINSRTLQQTVRFHQEFSKPKLGSPLIWTHYRLLLTVKDKTERDRWHRRIIKESLNSNEFEQIIRDYKKKAKLRTERSQSPRPPAELEVIRGKLWTYQVLQPETLKPSEGTVVLDCGFDIWRELPCDSGQSFKQGDVVSLEDNISGGVRIKKIDATAQFFTYEVSLEKVIDGDTVWVYINLGFGTWTRQKLRLNGIDCPELPTPEGLRAKQFVEERLTKALCIIIKSYKNDKYDRYLSDIFYSLDTTNLERTAREGIFLNQELLDEGLATVWKD